MNEVFFASFFFRKKKSLVFSVFAKTPRQGAGYGC